MCVCVCVCVYYWAKRPLHPILWPFAKFPLKDVFWGCTDKGWKTKLPPAPASLFLPEQLPVPKKEAGLGCCHGNCSLSEEGRGWGWLHQAWNFPGPDISVWVWCSNARWAHLRCIIQACEKNEWSRFPCSPSPSTDVRGSYSSLCGDKMCVSTLFAGSAPC